MTATVVQLFRAAPATAAAAPRPDVSHSQAVENMRRRHVLGDVARLLRENAVEGATMTLVGGADDALRVEAAIGATRTTLCGPYGMDRVDDLAGVVRAGVSRWSAALARRAAMRIATGRP